MTRTYALASVALIGVLMAGTGVAIYLAKSGDADQFAQCRQGIVAGGGGSIGGPFELVSETGETVTDADVITEPTLMYFGYTSCPDVCPLDSVRNAEAVDMLEERGFSVQPTFVTVDPNRDTPEVMAAFTDNVHPRMLGLTGTTDQTQAAASAYRVYYQVHDDGTDPYYLVDHTAFTYLMLPEVGFAEFFNRDVTPGEMAERTACFIEAAG
ncbi:SCO family protein [Gymnodinialimonas ceratoperidinii]|uniref:SCO family protein n=1 Tax=Gymnodinialimonas ceratoperidinii TaxID=2856823 RepID=A0A8F6TY97_9RHOB|nr:SCO family protein [Gymnodinialimonas ceratoperidinii]QXT40169.1 SCO family protein [Gymnodinialimonas ceratoperidinii]